MTMKKINEKKTPEKEQTPATLQFTQPPEPSKEKLTIKSVFERPEAKKKFQEMLGKNSAAFITSVLNVCTDPKLATADPISVYQAAAVAASLNLPIDPNLGFAYILAYNVKQSDGTYKNMAQFQMGWKGYVQLALRSNQFKTLNACAIYEGQLLESNPLDGYKFDFTKKKSETVVGYAAKFTLINGFEATWFMTLQQLNAHGVKYSKTFQKGYGLWKDNFDAMASKTVIKLLLSKYAPLSVDMQKSILFDQSVINDFEKEDIIYTDHEDIPIDKASERIALMIKDSVTVEELQSYLPHIKEEQMELFETKLKELTS